ncbi:MocR-like pyridoxine biosynthesis transcription factor PdxR [Maribrevibacterium harenarium]|uniref:MocR-like pyridoxine biosynthesis transcription factor PdxR n=1 Tax=Maribrevibacterium harenarium TaxID=2589817 RepID=UPI0015E2A540|nr:PLP-dependent aminotransferase family protein [Maribrevibacterium harenarium]
MGQFVWSLDDAAVDRTGKRIPRFQQLYQQVCQGVVSGRLPVGCRLPSSRVLAQELGVSRSVVVQAYDQLLAEGVLISVAKTGLYVADGQPMAKVAPTKLQTNKPVPHTKLCQFDSGADVQMFPKREWAASMRRAWLNPASSVLTGEATGGYEPLQRALSQYLLQLRGLECAPEQVFIVAGNRDALALLQHTLQRSVAHWCIEDPCYPPIRASFAQHLTLPIDTEGARPPTGSRWAAVLTPCRQYPLGMAYSSLRRELWLNALAAEQGFIIEDDYDNEFIYHGKPQVPWYQVAALRGVAQERIFYVGSLSKVLFRGLRLGFVVVPKSWVSRVAMSQQQLGNAASLPLQPVVADFIETGAFYRHLNRMRRHYLQKRDYLLALLEQHLAPWFTWERPSGGMHCLIYLKNEYAIESRQKALHQYAQHQGLHLSWLADHFSLPGEHPKGLVLGFTAPSTEELEQWVKLLAKGMIIA